MQKKNDNSQSHDTINIHDAFFQCIKDNDLAGVEETIIFIARMDIVDAFGWMPLHRAAASDTCGIIDILVENSALVDAPGNGGWRPLHLAVVHGNTFAIKALLRHKAGVNTTDEKGNTPLHLITFNQSLENTGLLIQAGADTGLKNAEGMTPAQMLQQRGRPNADLLAALLQEAKNKQS